jgi:hypothetical protein|tara:strand:- start:4455 stop:5681 length:1227 start_codon:yes stop_codon:yes gene_type:complete
MKKLFYNISIVILSSLIIRIFFFFNFSDLVLDNEWGILFHNLNTTGTLGLNVVINDLVAAKHAEAGDTVLPSAFMPPLYVFYIYVINFFFSESINLVNLVILTQIVLACSSTFIFFKIIKKFFSYKNSILLSYLFSFYPLNVLASLQISSITLQLFLFLIFIFYFIVLVETKSYKNAFLLGVFSGLMMLTRGEFGIFFILSNLYLFFILKINYRKILICMLFSLLVVTPYLVRNYSNFDSIFLVKSLGYNLLKGNNPKAKAEGHHAIFESINSDLKINNNYEINLDDIYKSEAINIIKSEPFKYIKLYFLKMFAFIFIDLNSTYPNYYNIFHLVPKVALSVLSLFGGLLLLRKKGVLQHFTLFYFLSACFFSLFFILPRYSLMFLPIQILLGFYAFIYLKEFFKKKKI